MCENSRFNEYSFDEPAIALRASDGKISNENVVAISGNYFGNDVDEEDVEEMIVHKHDFNNAGKWYAYKLLYFGGTVELNLIVLYQFSRKRCNNFCVPESGYHLDSLFVDGVYIGTFDNYTL